jgi:hypothetical protein
LSIKFSISKKQKGGGKSKGVTEFQPVLISSQETFDEFLSHLLVYDGKENVIQNRRGLFPAEREEIIWSDKNSIRQYLSWVSTD